MADIAPGRVSSWVQNSYGAEEAELEMLRRFQGVPSAEELSELENALTPKPKPSRPRGRPKKMPKRDEDGVWKMLAGPYVIENHTPSSSEEVSTTKTKKKSTAVNRRVSPTQVTSQQVIEAY